MRPGFQIFLAAGIIFSTLAVQAGESPQPAITDTENIRDVFFAPRHEAVIYAEISERVTRITKEFGESFSREEPLLFLDDKFYQLQYQKYEAQLAHAKAAAEQAEILYQKQSELKSARAQLATAMSRRDSLKKMIQAELNLKPLMAEKEVAQQNWESTERLYRDNAVSSMTLEEAKRDYIIAEANLENFKLRQELDLRDVEDAVITAQLNLDLAEANQKPALEAAKKNLAIAQFNRDSSL
ncbi:MAG: hypothetical protein JXA52_06075, partial [Planctomycetes bacterium]|nr:hypothetical protein [Planctomycetota bacterium]